MHDHPNTSLKSVRKLQKKRNQQNRTKHYKNLCSKVGGCPWLPIRCVPCLWSKAGGCPWLPLRCFPRLWYNAGGFPWLPFVVSRVCYIRLVAVRSNRALLTDDGACFSRMAVLASHGRRCALLADSGARFPRTAARASGSKENLQECKELLKESSEPNRNLQKLLENIKIGRNPQEIHTSFEIFKDLEIQ